MTAALRSGSPSVAGWDGRGAVLPCPLPAGASTIPAALEQACARMAPRLRNPQRYIAQGVRLATGKCAYGRMRLPPDPGKPHASKAQVTLKIDSATCQVLVEVGGYVPEPPLAAPVATPPTLPPPFARMPAAPPRCLPCPRPRPTLK